MGENGVFQYENVRYTFEVRDEIKNDECGKYIQKVRFRDRAPGGLRTDSDYILESLYYSHNVYITHVPALRQYWDFFPFEGDNFREILLCNDEASKLQKSLRENGDTAMTQYTEGTIFMLLEPLYDDKVTKDKLKQHGDLRLEYLRQCCLGLQQLYRNGVKCKSKLGADIAARFDAYRDLKLGNALLQWDSPGKAFTVRLIDFATVHVEPSGNATNKGAISPSNTAPEDQNTSYIVGPHTDVWALGGMLGELFGSCNPVSALNDDSDWLKKKCPTGHDWMEEKLGDKFSWDADGTEDIKELFRSATKIKPGDRISVDEFRGKLEGLMGLPNPYFAAVIDPSLLPEYAEEISNSIAGSCPNCGGRVFCPDSSGKLRGFELFPNESCADALKKYQRGSPVDPKYVKACIEQIIHCKSEYKGYNDQLFLFLPDKTGYEHLQSILRDFHDNDSELNVMLYMPSEAPQEQFGYDDVASLQANGLQEQATPSPIPQCTLPKNATASKTAALDRYYGEIGLEDGWTIVLADGKTLYVGRKENRM